jgi:hypothetical protein
VIGTCLILPLSLLAIEWNKSRKQAIVLSILSLSAVLYGTAFVRGLKLILLGTDYSNRLFTTIIANLLIAIALGIYMKIKRRRFAAIAAVILAFGWFVLWGINTAV